MQWATLVPSGWVEIDAADWAGLPTRQDPDSSSRADNQAGYVNRLCVQGVELTADHYAVEPMVGPNGEDGCRVYTWSDAPPRDNRPGYEEGTRYARVWEFLPLAPDPEFGGAYNTRQTQTVFAESTVLDHYDLIGVPRKTVVRPWDEFVVPTDIAKHGIWLPDRIYAQHESIRPVRGWREWSEHLDPAERTESGLLLPQRAQGRYDVPKGTRTYYMSDQTEAAALLTATYENLMTTTPTGAVSLVSQNFSGGESAVELVGTTPVGEPDHVTWPTGDYRYQVDVTSAGGDISYGLMTLGTALGGFARVTSNLGAQIENKQQIQAAFVGSGLWLATTGNVSWLAGLQSDRFQVKVAVVRAANHGNQSITFQVGESDDFADGPWAAGQAPVQENAPFFGCNF